MTILMLLAALWQLPTTPEGVAVRPTRMPTFIGMQIQHYHKECLPLTTGQVHVFEWPPQLSPQAITIPAHVWWATIHPDDPEYPPVVDWTLVNYRLSVLRSSAGEHRQSWSEHPPTQASYGFRAPSGGQYCFAITAIGQYPIVRGRS